jgi:signal transduction histidine kinase
MSETIDDFRDFFKANKKEVEFSINKTIRDTFFMVRPGFTHNGISLDIHEEDEIKVIGFQNEYSQVILNIFNNAKDAIVKRTTKGRVVVDVFHKNNSAVVKIRDNGGGIPENILNKVFDPYFTTKGEEKGTGLGLYMSRMIIEDHMNGSIGVANTDEGAEFTITLPLKKSST